MIASGRRSRHALIANMDHDRSRSRNEAIARNRASPGTGWAGRLCRGFFRGSGAGNADARSEAPRERPDRPIDPRQVEEQALDSRLSVEFQGIEDQLSLTSDGLENLIQQADDRGYFLEDCPAEPGHDPGLGFERGNDDGGRERE